MGHVLMVKNIIPWLLVLFVLALFAAVPIILMRPATDTFVLSLSISPARISRDAFFAGHLHATVYFTNNSDKNLEFWTNGVDCFQFLDIGVFDEAGKNWATCKYGDSFIVNFTANKTHVVEPGERFGSTVGIESVVWQQPLQGRYKVQAFLRYQELDVSSNTVELTITP